MRHFTIQLNWDSNPGYGWWVEIQSYEILIVTLASWTLLFWKPSYYVWLFSHKWIRLLEIMMKKHNSSDSEENILTVFFIFGYLRQDFTCIPLIVVSQISRCNLQYSICGQKNRTLWLYFWSSIADEIHQTFSLQHLVRTQWQFK